MKIQVTSSLKHYPAIWDADAGCYVWVTPDASACQALVGLLRTAPFKTFDATELHTTVLYSPTLPDYRNVPDFEDGVNWYDGDIVAVESWIDHKNRTIVVLKIESKPLQDLHDALLKVGFTYTYPDYKAHMTIAKGIELDAAARLWINKLNERLENNPIPISFGQEIKATSLS